MLHRSLEAGSGLPDDGPPPQSSSRICYPAEANAKFRSKPVPEHLQIATRPLSRPERLVAFVAAAALLLAALLLTPDANRTWHAVPGFIIAYSTGSCILDALVATLLVAKGRIEKDNTSVLLAMAYAYVALITIPHIACFPDAWVPGMLIGAPGSAVWLWVFWHGGFGCLVLRYGMAAGRAAGGATVPPRLLTAILGVLLMVSCACYLSLRRLDLLPVILTGTHYFNGATGLLIMAAVLAVNFLALAVVIARLSAQRAEDLWLAVGMVGACVDVWLTLCGHGRFTQGWYCGRICGLTTSFMLFFSLLGDLLLTYNSVSLANNVLDQMTQTDPLTQLGNRRKFDDTLQREWRRCWRDNLPLSVILFDVDEFKLYNDTYGHQAGDTCLERIGARLADAAARAGDLATRYGGEEFALILPATDSDGGAYVANMVRLTVRDAAIAHGATERGVVTLSAGVATLIPSDSFEASELVRLADLALYRAKAAGRDNVAIAG